VRRVAFVKGGEGKPFEEEVDWGEAVVEVMVEFGDWMEWSDVSKSETGLAC
jgi:hypothetical protein